MSDGSSIGEEPQRHRATEARLSFNRVFPTPIASNRKTNTRCRDRLCGSVPLWLFLTVAFSIAVIAPTKLRAADAPSNTAAENLLRKANGLYERQYFKQAADDYAIFLQQFSNHPQAPAVRFTLGICRYRTQDFAQAITDLTGVIRDANFPQRDEALVVIGHCNFALKKYPEAIAA